MASVLLTMFASLLAVLVNFWCEPKKNPEERVVLNGDSQRV